MAKWFIQRNGKQAGPFESAQLKQLAAEGKIRPEDQIRRDDQDKWHNAEKVKGLFEPVAKPPDTVTKEPLPETAEWLRNVNGQETGPMSFLEVCEKFRSGEIGATDFIAQRSMKWVQAGLFLEPAVLENATSADEWFITSGEEVKGPFSFSQLQDMHESKQLAESDLLGRKGAKGIAADILIKTDADTFSNRLSDFLYEKNDNELRVTLGNFCAFCFTSMWLLWGCDLWVCLICGFVTGFGCELMLQKLFDVRLKYYPIPYAIIAIGLGGYLCYNYPPELANGGILTPIGPKYAAFKTLVDAYTSTPYWNVTANQLKKHEQSIEKAQEAFVKVQFDPEKKTKEAKAIADLYMRKLYGSYEGHLHDELYFNYLTPIIDAVKDDVVIPPHVRRRWDGGR